MNGRRTKAIGIACGVVCAACVALFLASVQGEAEQARAEVLERYGGDQIEVCVAARDIAPGETIDASAVETKTWVSDLLPEGAVTSVSDVVGKQTTSSILAGEVVSTRRFGERSALIDVPAGYTAVSVPAQEVQAVGGAVTPGAYVDVYATGGTSTDLIGDDVLVLATSASTSSDEASGSVKWITLAVEPESVQEFVSAAQTTNLYFALPGESRSAAGREEGDGHA